MPRPRRYCPKDEYLHSGAKVNILERAQLPRRLFPLGVELVRGGSVINGGLPCFFLSYGPNKDGFFYFISVCIAAVWLCPGC